MFKHEFRDLQIEFSLGDEPLGTVGEILEMKNLIDGDFAIWYMDELTKVELDKLVETHDRGKEHGGLATLALVRNVPLEVGIVEWIPEDGVGPRIVDFREKPLLNKMVWAGIAIINPEALEYAEAGDDFGADLFPRLLREEKKIYGFTSQAEWYDCGTLSHYRKVCKLAEEGLL